MIVRTIAHILLGILPCLAFASAPLSQTQHASATEEKARVVISFHSKGSGINEAAREKLDEFVANYEAETGIKLAQEIVHWGREGEVDSCFKLTELAAEEQETVIAALKSALKGADRVTLEENVPGRNQPKKPKPKAVTLPKVSEAANHACCRIGMLPSFDQASSNTSARKLAARENSQIHVSLFGPFSRFLG